MNIKYDRKSAATQGAIDDLKIPDRKSAEKLMHLFENVVDKSLEHFLGTNNVKMTYNHSIYTSEMENRDYDVSHLKHIKLNLDVRGGIPLLTDSSTYLFKHQ